MTGAVALGSGIWTMHYGGMLAIETPLIMQHDLAWFLLSIVVAVVLAMLAISSIAITIAVTVAAVNGLIHARELSKSSAIRQKRCLAIRMRK